MSDQANVQSPESRLMAFLDGEVEDDVAPNLDAEPEEVEVEAVETNPDEQAEEETEGEPDAEEAEEEEAEEANPEYFTLKVNGEEITKPKDEVIALAQQGVDYTQKTQALAEQRKAIEEQAQALQAQEQALQEQVLMQEALIDDVAQLKAIDRQLDAYSQVNWQQLSDQDFVEAQKLFFTYNQLQTQRNELAQALQAKVTQVQQLRTQQTYENLEKGRAKLAQEIPNWSPQVAQQLRATGLEYGLTEAQVDNISDPIAVKILYDAMQWRNQQKNPIIKNKIAQAKPVVKPGSKDTQTVAKSQVKQTRDALRKTGKSEYAQKLIENML